MSGLVARELGVRLGRREVLRDIGFSCANGEVIGLVGPNGAGKTTLLRALAGLLPLSAGAIELHGDRLASMRDRERAQCVAYLPQERVVNWPLAARDVVMLGRLPHRGAMARASSADEETVAGVMERLDVAGLAARPVTTLSGGERARVLIARAFAQMPRLLLADEPTSGLDPAHQIETMDFLREAAREGRVVVVTLHDLTQAARWCDRLLVLDGGRLVADAPPDEALADERLRDVFDIEAARLRHHGLVLVPTRSVRDDATSTTGRPPT